MAQVSAEDLLATAKRHLGSPPTATSVPRFYLEELRRHLSMYPNEDKFLVTLQPNTGFGSVTCLKDNCHAVVPLNRRAVRGGGKRDGFGSLSAYRTHLSMHVKRETRAVTESENNPSQAQTAPPKTNKGSFLNSPSRPALAPTSQNSISAPQPPRVKAEPVEPMIPRKRLSDIGANVESSDTDNTGPSQPKKPKMEMTPNATQIIRDIGDVETRVQEIRQAIRLQERLGIAMYSSNTLDITEINAVDKETKRLRTLELEYLSRLNALHRSLPQTSVVQTSEAVVMQDQKPARPLQEFPMQFDNLDRKPAIGEGSTQSSESNWTSTIPRPYPTFNNIERKPFSTPVETQQPVPGASSSTSSVAPGGQLMQRVSSVANYVGNAVASSSKALYSALQDIKPQIPGAYDMEVDSDSDERDSEDEETVSDALIMPFVHALGVHAPPPMVDDAHDDNGDYHGRGRDLFIGPRAAADDIENFLIEAGNAETFDGNESVDKALNYLGLQNLHMKLPGMEISLMAHQAMGVAWMLEKERSTLLGGCLADEMGLGKTIQMITTMVLNRSQDPARKTTLIIAPLALLDQWKLEIEEKSNCGFTCLIYHGHSRTKKRSQLVKHDVVLTTFNTMAAEWPDYENEMKKKAKARKKKDDFIVPDPDEEDMKDVHYRNNKRKQHAGLLFQTEFYRIVADEGQQIRNRRTRMSRAITDLRTRYRWVLTGTPIVNGLADVYGYLRFLRIRPWYDWAHFQSHIGILEKKNPALAVARLQKVMTTFLLRRKKDSKLDGKNLIELPAKKIELAKLEFSEEEREIYSMVEARSQAKFNRYLREGTVLKNYHQVLVLLLRLRQICSHPCLIQEDGVAFVHRDDAKVRPKVATELTRASRLVSPEFVEKMKAKMKQEALNRMQAEKESANATIEEEECPICYDAMTDAVVTACSHVFCRDCIVATLNRAPSMDAEPGSNPNDRPCPVCRSAISPEKFFSCSAFEPTNADLGVGADSDDEDMDEDSDSDSDASYKGKGKAVAKPRTSGRVTRRKVVNSSDYEDDDDISDFIVESDEDEEEKDARRALKQRSTKKNVHIILDSDDELDTPEVQEVIFGVRKKVEAAPGDIQLMSRFLPSTKMKHMMNLLEKLAKTNPEEKTLVVSQWTGCLSLVSDYLTENGIPHVKYQGDMNRAKRDQAVKVFMSKEKARVMLMSLKCGGVGLNLTRANNVISLDLGWSQAVESQAYDRVHRLGQTRAVTVQRVVIADTVEDRILALQERKQALADGSLGEGKGQKIGKLSVKELANLFGLDARGRRLIA
ncbi:hypothetical protein BDN70DRAFT_822530 [Pholiota conissans]|uniref:Uncharacterized protein n=1 Tax=Pholiota conissans TaxID=109636 RepID=A0A9P6D732_9AGAR|nr:hypothetical protein BDN70DRAFT_822530 [Pholiota conissans]